MKVAQRTSFQRTSLLHKKGSLELSINAIVILIMAITMLGLGLGFMKGLFSKTTGQLEKVGEDIKNQMVEQLRSSSAKLTLNEEDITIKRGETKEIYFGIKNVEDDLGAFNIVVDCPNNLANPPAPPLEPTTFDSSRSLKKGEVDVQKMIINAPASAIPTTHSCELELIRGDSYAKKSFFVTVQ